MEQYRTEEEQVEALRKWWEENGRSTIVAIIVALGLGFGWQGWQKYQQGEQENASNSYQNLLQQIAEAGTSGDQQGVITLGEQIKQEYARSTYAQFAALHLARLAVNRADLSEAEAQLRWVLGRADQGSDTQQVAQLRLARVLASRGDTDQALSILAANEADSYKAAYAAARGDILLLEGRSDEARDAYNLALRLAANGEGQVNLGLLQQKLQSLSPVEPQVLPSPDSMQVSGAAADAETVGASQGTAQPAVREE